MSLLEENQPKSLEMFRANMFDLAINGLGRVGISTAKVTEVTEKTRSYMLVDFYMFQDSDLREELQSRVGTCVEMSLKRYSPSGVLLRTDSFVSEVTEVRSVLNYSDFRVATFTVEFTEQLHADCVISS